MGSLKILEDSISSAADQKIGYILAVAAGKGGVGKSSVSVNLALALRNQGFRVGLLDADVYGPSLRQMLPEGMEPIESLENPDRLMPAITFGMSFISVAHFKKEASIIRAPIANQIINQFLNVVDWGVLDYLIIDFPPGTGDIQLTLMQKAKIDAAIMVTTPQTVSTIDVRKAVQLFQKMEIPVLGVIENMSYFIEPLSQTRHTPFGAGGAKDLAKEFSIPILGEIPLEPKISEMGDRGQSLFDEAPESMGCKAFISIAGKVLEQVQCLSKEALRVRQLDAGHLGVYIDDQERKVALYKLQKHCPCARCEKQKKVDENVSLLEFSPVGRYALRITFSSGCSQGIYPISLLRKLVL